MSESVTVKRHGPVLEIILDRPPVNAINLATSCELYAAFAQLQEDPALRVGLLRATGDRVFSAGWDLKEFAAQGDQLQDSGNYDLGPGGLGGLPEFWQLHKPVIACVNGKAIGGGFEMLLAADLLIAAEHAEFSLPDIHLGFLPDAGGMQRLAKRLPYNLAMEMLLTGNPLSASRAQAAGLVAEVVPARDLAERGMQLAQQIAAAAPLALQAAKEVMNACATQSIEQSFQQTRQAWQGNSGLPVFETMLRSDDYLEGSRAFAEKRPPNYQGC